MKRILVTGATGQIGSELTMALRERFGMDNVIAAGHKKEIPKDLINTGPWCTLDVRSLTSLERVIADNQIDTIYHLASLLSAVSETETLQAWDINMNGLINILESARSFHCSVFFPSSIAAFGPQTPARNTPQDTIQRPNTIYGITKLSGELLCDYYTQHYDVDVRGVRYPGLISWKTLPGGGTTDYAVEIFYEALQNKSYSCFLKADTQLDMMYMPDALNAAIDIMQADPLQLIHHNSFNVTAMSFTPAQLAKEIQRHIPEFTITYDIDPVRQTIAESWPRHIDDGAARKEWGWQASFDLPEMVTDMLDNLSKKLQTQN